MPAREAWGLDIGQTALHAVKLRRLKGDACEIADLYIHPLETDLEDSDFDDKVFEALNAFAEEKEVGKTPVVASLPGYATLFRDFSLPQVSDSRLGEIVSYEAKQLIPYPLDEVIWDFHRLQEDEETGEIGIALVCCRRDIVDTLLGLLDESKLNVAALQVGPVALVNYLQYEAPPEGATLILDTGARGTDFVVVNGGAFWLRSIGVSGTDLTKALMSKFSIPYEKAEELKREVGESKQGDRVFRVMEPVLRNLCGEVQRSVGYYKSLYRGVNLEEIVCAGNTYLLNGVDQFLADNTGLPARSLGVPEEIECHFSVPQEDVEENRQVLGSALGLALQGIGISEIQTSLLPRERRVAQFVQAKLKFAIAAVAIVLFTVAINLLTAGGDTSRFKDQMKDINRISLQAEKAVSEMKTIQAQFPAEEERNRALAMPTPTRGYLNEAVAVVSAALAELNNNPSRKVTAEKKAEQMLPAAINGYKQKHESLFTPNEEAENGEEDVKWKLDCVVRQFKRRLAWRYNRLDRVFLDDSDYEIVKVVQVVDEDDETRTWWQEFSKEATRASAEYGIDDDEMGDALPAAKEPVYAVKIHLKGRMITPSLATALLINRRLARIRGALPFKHDPQRNLTDPILWKTTPNLTQEIKVPAIMAPKIVKKELDGGATEEAGKTRPDTSSQEDPASFTFEQVKEPATGFEVTFYYLPTLHKSKKVEPAATED